MRKRKHLIWALGLALAVGVSSIALGSGNTLNTQSMKVTLTPSKQSKTKFGNAKLRSVTTTGTTGTGNFAITPVDRAVIYYDKDIKFDTSGLPQCRQSLTGLTTAQAKAKCGKAYLGTGRAEAHIAGNPAAGSAVETTISAFNGKPIGGKPVILLHVYSPVLGTSQALVLVGKLSKLSGKYGWKLDVTVPQLLAGSATTIFDVSVSTSRGSRLRRSVVMATRSRSGPGTTTSAPSAATASGSTRARSITRATAARPGPVPCRPRRPSPARSSSDRLATRKKFREGRPPGRPSL